MPIKPPSYNRKQQAQRKARSHRSQVAQKLYNERWARYSKVRRIEYPLCVMCLDKGRENATDTVTDHIKPASHFPELFWSTSNHQTLCRSCNSTKQRKDSVLYGS